MQTILDLFPLACFGYAIICFYRWVARDAARAQASVHDG